MVFSSRIFSADVDVVFSAKIFHEQSRTIAHHKDLQMDSQIRTKRVLTFSLFMYKNKYITTLNFINLQINI